MNKNRQQLDEQFGGLLWWIIQQFLNGNWTWEQVMDWIEKHFGPTGIPSLPLWPNKELGPDDFELMKQTHQSEERMIDNDWNSLVESAANIGRGLNEQSFPQLMQSQQRRKQEIKGFPQLTPKDTGQKRVVDVDTEARNLIALLLNKQNQNQMIESINKSISTTKSRYGKSNVGLNFTDALSTNINNNTSSSNNPLWSGILLELLLWIYQRFFGPLFYK